MKIGKLVPECFARINIGTSFLAIYLTKMMETVPSGDGSKCDSFTLIDSRISIDATVVAFHSRLSDKPQFYLLLTSTLSGFCWRGDCFMIRKGIMFISRLVHQSKSWKLTASICIWRIIMEEFLRQMFSQLMYRTNYLKHLLPKFVCAACKE